MFVQHNSNPTAARTGDCAVRAIARATGKSWDNIYLDLCILGYTMGDWGSSNAVWGAYLKRCGFTRQALPASCPDCYTVADFADEHPKGIYVLALSGHVVTVVDGRYYDTWDSGDEMPLYYWCKED